MASLTLERVRAAAAALKRPLDARSRVPLAPFALPIGRRIVAPNDVVDPTTWGNPCYDQTVQVFASSVARGQQWPNPLEGARSYLTADSYPYHYVGGAWQGDPGGHIASATGPAAQLDLPTATTTLVSIPMRVAGPRRLLVSFSWWATNITGLSASIQSVYYLAVMGYVPFAAGMIATGRYDEIRKFTTTGTNTFTLTLMAGGTPGGAFRFAANSCRIAVTDMGTN